MQGEHYIRGLSDHELEKVVGLNRDMYTKAELQVADEETARRSQARSAKAAATAPAATPQPAESPATKAAVEKDTASGGGIKPPPADRATAIKNTQRLRENNLRRKSTGLNRSVVGEDYCMPPPEEREEPGGEKKRPKANWAEAEKNTHNSQDNTVRRKKYKPDRSIVGKDYCMPPPEELEEPGSGTKTLAANWASTTKNVQRYRENALRRRNAELKRSIVGEDYCMPPPEGPEEPGSNKKPPVARKTPTVQNAQRSLVNNHRRKDVDLNRSIVGDDYCMPPPEGMLRPLVLPDPVGTYMHCTNCGNLCRIGEVYCSNCGQKPI